MSTSFLRAVVCLVIAAAAATAQAQTTVTLQDGLNGYSGTIDNYQYSSLPDDNNGAMALFAISNANSMGLVRFPIFALEGGPVPNGANIVSATLAMYKWQGPDSVFKANRLLKSWHEMQSTYNVASAGVPWQTAGANGAADILGTADGQGSIGAAAGWVSIDVTSSVQAFSGGSPNHGWRLGYVSGSTASKDFRSRNYSTDTTLRPKLTITYTVGSPGLPAPENLDASLSGLTVTLRWQDMSSDETQFKIERKTGQSGTYAEIGTVGANVTQFADATVAANNTYFYRVRASNGGGNGPYSIKAGVTVTTVSNDGQWTMDYSYDAFGNLVQTTAAGIVVSMTYDLRGRKTAMNDPDMGAWTYVYNALGELKRQTDAKSQVTTMAYDLLGRMTNRTEPDLISNWTYDSCTKGIGKLCQVTSDNSYSRTLGYDQFGRTSQISTTFDATPYNVLYGYDASGRLAQITYPTGFVAKYVYNSYGHTQSLTDGSGATVYWQANTMNAAGQVLNESLANGAMTSQRTYDAVERPLSNVVWGSAGTLQSFFYTWDDVGNLIERNDSRQGITEGFSYDKLNRVDISSGSGLVTKTYSYDVHGNILYRSDVGTYTYGAKPHAVANVSGSHNASYSYDDNGNMISGAGRTLTYTSFNMPATISANGHSYTYTYGPDHERMRLVLSSLGKTFIYLHPNGAGSLLYEKETRTDGSIRHRHYLSVAGRTIGMYYSRSDGTSETRYFHHDHIGSLTLVTDSAGGVLDRMAYEAFGKRRFPSGADDPGNTIAPGSTDRGFTMHEHLDEITLIHMNGRVYDPLLARFMTPDPFIQAPFNLQAYNRYSYVFNNPLRGYDPSGFVCSSAWQVAMDACSSGGGNFLDDLGDALGDFAEKVVHVGEKVFHEAEKVVKKIETSGKKVVEDVKDVAEDVGDKLEQFAKSDVGKAVIAVAATYVTAGAATYWLGANAIVAGAAGGFAGSFVGSGGNIEAGIVGGLTGMVTAGLGAAGSAVVGCASSAASGGSCGRGAVIGGLAGLAGGMLPSDGAGRIIGSAVLGGTVSKLSGGSFKVGAVTGAATASFAYLFAPAKPATSNDQGCNGCGGADDSSHGDGFQRVGHGGTPGDPARQNKMVRDVQVKLGLTNQQRQQLHREISGQNMSYQQILNHAKDMFGK